MQKKHIIFLSPALLLIAVFLIPALSYGEGAKKKGLPVIMETMPRQLYRILGPVSAQKKEMGDARNRLRKEAKKLDADAILQVVCEKGGTVRQGLTWHRTSSYCRGIAIRFIDENGAP